jgi:hypothetical protein
MPEPLVSIIIVHWNEANLLRQCLLSIKKSDYADPEVIVVDNASTDDAVAMVRREFRGVKLIENKENLGFARGNNIGIQASRGKYVIILNADTTVEPGWVRAQVQAMEADPTIGMCQGKMMLMREPGKINSIGMGLDRHGLTRHIGDGETDRGQYETPRPVFAVSGACAVCRREMLDQIGLFDEDYFLYCEDLDLSWRAWIRGWKCVYVPGAVLHHYRNASVDMDGSLYWRLRYFNQRNRLWTLWKNCSCSTLLRCAPGFLAHDLVMTTKGLKAWLTRSRPPVELKARWDALLGLGKTLRKRRLLQRARVTPDRDLRNLAFAQLR